MKPSFALTLSAEKIELLHRTSQGWHPVGAVAFDDPDLPAALGYLRGSALGLEPQGLATKLVIPNSEILYLRIAAPGPKAAQRRGQIAAALDGRTPYAVEDLAFDWSGTGDEVQVAVVARETLAEAEAFAVEHRFNPVSFVAIPPPDRFGAEPWFGTPKAAEALIASGTRIARDQDPIRIVARDLPRPADPGAATAPAEAGATVPPDAAPAAQSAGDAAEMPAPGERPSAGIETARAAGSETGAASYAVAPAPAPADGPPAAAETDGPAATTRPQVETATSLPAAEGPAATAPAQNPPPREPAEAELSAAAPPALPPDPDTSATAAAASLAAPAPAPDDPPARRPVLPSLETPSAEADPPPRREAEIRVLPPRPPIPDKPPVVTPLARGTPSAPPRKAAAALHAVNAETVQRPARKFGKQTPPPRGPGKPTRPSLVSSSQPMRPGKVAATLSAVPPPGTAPSPTTASLAPGGAAAAADAAFRRAKPVRSRRWPVGLILTGLLVLLLAAVAVWAALFLDRPPEAASDVDPAASAPATLASSPPPAAPAGDEAAATTDATAELPPAQADTAASAVLGDALDLPADAVPEAPEPLPPDTLVAAPPQRADTAPIAPATPPQADAPATVATLEAPPSVAPRPRAAPPADHAADAATDTAPPEPPPAALRSDTAADGSRGLAAEPFEEIFLPSPDPTIALDAPRPLGPLASLTPGPLPGPPMPPPPFGTVYRFDADGRILPTPEGVVTPDGVRLVAGRPPLLPRPRPEPAAVAAAPAADEPAAAPEAGTAPAAAEDAPEPAAAPDPRLAGAKPRARPEGAAARDTVEEESALESQPTPGGVVLASLKPRTRAASVVARAEAQRAADAAAEAQAAAEAAAASPLAVAISRKPAARPASFATLAVASPARTPAPAAAAAARPAPQQDDDLDDGEPAVTRAAPAIPTRTSVARQATVTNAINLSRINLIGVYGAANNRHALVRMAGGGFQRVKVGDRLDGGQVSAIGANELRYVKGGRTITLGMPRG